MRRNMLTKKWNTLGSYPVNEYSWYNTLFPTLFFGFQDLGNCNMKYKIGSKMNHLLGKKRIERTLCWLLGVDVFLSEYTGALKTVCKKICTNAFLIACFWSEGQGTSGVKEYFSKMFQSNIAQFQPFKVEVFNHTCCYEIFCYSSQNYRYE